MTGWALLAFLAVGTGLGALRYALPRVPFPSPLPNFVARHDWLVAHAVFSALALLVGPWQFASAFRRRSVKVHRWMRRVYCGAVAAGWFSSLPIAAHAQTGVVASAGFLISWCKVNSKALIHCAQRSARCGNACDASSPQTRRANRHLVQQTREWPFAARG